MYKRMLVPLDGSELAEVVFVYAKELAGRLNLDLVFLHVCAPEQSESTPMHRAYIERAAEIVRHQSQEVQEKSGIHPGIKAVEAQAELMVGYPAEEILRYVDENDIDLILIASHGRSGIRRWTMGSVADKILRASKVAALLVPAGIPGEIVYDEWPTRTLLVPLDGSELAEAVLPHVEALAKQRGIELMNVVLLTVCEPPDIMSPDSYYLIPESYPPTRPLKWKKYVEQEMGRCKQACEQYLAGVEERLKDTGLKVRAEVLMGKPADKIVEYTTQNPLNLTIMATHGRSGLSQWAYGSVTHKVLHGVSSPILLVRPG